MSKTVGQGIKATYTIDTSYFTEGEAYSILVDGIFPVKAILMEVKNNKLRFAYLKVGEITYLEITLNQLLNDNNYDIVKLIPDYRQGKFGV